MNSQVDVIVIGDSYDGYDAVKKIASSNPAIKMVFVSKKFRSVTTHDYLNVEYVQDEVVFTDYKNRLFGVYLKNGTRLYCTHLIIASGLAYAPLLAGHKQIPNVFNNVDDIPKHAKNQPAVVIGNTNNDVKFALAVAKKYKQVYLCTPGMTIDGITKSNENKLAKASNIVVLPNTSIIKQGMLSEVMVKYMLAYDGIAEPEYDNTHANRIRILKNNDLLPREIDNTLYILRKARNDAAHNATDEGEKALNNLQLVYELCVWYMQTYGDYTYEPADYVQPVDISVSLADLEKENAELEARNQQLLIEIQQIQQNGKADSNRRTVAYQKALNVHLSEAQTRELIDEQLRKVGWEVDTKELRYSKGTRPTKGKNLAIAEWPTDSTTGNNGYADYALFIGEKLVGIVEAKKKHTNISSVLDGQCKAYAKLIKAEHDKYVIKQYGQYKVPFLFATNGRDYIKQYEDMSGIWFLDTRESFNAPKALAGWPSPEGMEQDLEKDIAEADKKLATTGYEILEDPNGLNLRYYQIEAIKAAEKAIADKQRAVLLAMATGTGKTRTVLGMIYRFLSAKRFKRILYLVDRTALGDQTMDTFKEVRLEDLKTLNQLYDIKDLGEKEFEKDTRVHIATVQSLVKRILYNESDVSLGVSDYDCIIVDEAHRGYILDKEMGEGEVLYRNQDDFRSKYRAVIDYFDAVKIALTATPALHTTEIFGKPVYEYTYRTAVVDGYL